MPDAVDEIPGPRVRQAEPTSRTLASATRLLPDFVSLGLGLLVFLVFYGPKLFSNDLPYLSAPVGDIAAELAAYFQFADDGWHFPLFALPNINLPEGSNMLFTGGVPLLALFAKIAHSLSNWTPNLIGPWYALCCVLQTHSTYFLMRQITDRRPLVLALASVVGALLNAFLTRTGHVSLFGQFLCIYPVGFVIATTNRTYSPTTILAWLAGFALVSMYVFAYLAIMNTAMFFAGALSLCNRKRLGNKQTFFALIGFAVLLVLCAFLGGYFWAVGKADPASVAGYTLYSFNIGSLFNDELFGPNWEGSFYLGRGVIGLWALIWLTGLAAIARAIRRNTPIVAVFGLLTAYSLSNRVHFLDYTIFAYPLPDFVAPVLGMARTSGRLFWPIGYLIVASAFAIVVARFPRTGPALVLAATLSACVEGSSAYRYLQILMNSPKQTPLDYPGLLQIMSEHKSLYVLPTNSCVDPFGHVPRLIAYQQVEFSAARASLSSNSSITARKIKDCAAEAHDVRAIQPGELGIFMSLSAVKASYAAQLGSISDQCRTFAIDPDEGYACSRSWERQTSLPVSQFRTINLPLQ